LENWYTAEFWDSKMRVAHKDKGKILVRKLWRNLLLGRKRFNWERNVEIGHKGLLLEICRMDWSGSSV